MKLLHVTSDWKWTGPAEPMLHAITGLRERGHSVDLICPEPEPGVAGALLERARARDVEPITTLPRGQGYRPLRDRPALRALRALLLRERYAVVHAHHTRDHILLVRALAGLRQALPTRLVASWHHGERLPRWPWVHWLFAPPRTDAIATLTPRLARETAVGHGFDPARVAAIPGVVDVKFFAPREPARALASELGIAPGDRVLGVVARLQPHRRFELLLESLGRAVEAHPNLRLLVVGRGTRAKQVLEEPVRRLGLERAVIQAGYRREDYRDVLSVMHGLAFLVPGSDGSCRAVLEAMSMGLPIVSSRRGILPELVQDGQRGRVVDEDPAALAAAMRDFASQPRVWSAYGRAAREHAVSQHRIELLGERLERLYASLCAGRSGS